MDFEVAEQKRRMTPLREINIAVEFSEFPAGRFEEDGDFNGTRFREEILFPRLKQAIDGDYTLVVRLDGLKSCGSSFLESAFGGLVRENQLDRRLIKKHLKIFSNNKAHQRYVLAIERHIEKAHGN